MPHAHGDEKSTDTSFHSLPRKTESVSSSSSVSPAPAHVSLPFPSSSFNQSMDVKTQFQMEPYSWSSSSSASIEEMTSFRASPMAMDYSHNATSRLSPSNEPGYQSNTTSVKHQLSSFRFPNSYNEPLTSYSNSSPQYRQFNHSHAQASSSDFHNFSQIPLVQVHPYNDVSSHLTLFDSHTLDANSSMGGVGWDGTLSAAESKPLMRSPLSNYSYV